MSSSAPSNRLYFLDWLRVLAFGLLIPYHGGLIFVDWGFHIQNNELTESLKLPMLFVNQWRLPLLFFISGAGTRFALNRRSAGQYSRDRLRRLLIPLVAGMLLVIPPQLYFERLSQGVSYGGYLPFYPHFFASGNFTWNHLWFIVYLLVYSFLFLPLFLWLRQRVASRWLSRNWVLWSLVLPLFITELLLRQSWPDTRNLVSDWYNFVFYGWCIMYGFLLADEPAVWPRIGQTRWVSLVIGIVSFGVLYVGWHAPGIGFLERLSFGWQLFSFIKCLNIWSWLLCFLGFARYYLSFSSSFLDYANKAVYPFYILHQTVLISIGYVVIQGSTPIALKYALIVLVTFLGTWLIYEFLIRRLSWLRLLFGLPSDRTA